MTSRETTCIAAGQGGRQNATLNMRTYRSLLIMPPLYILKLDVQFSNGMSNACPIGHFRENG